MEQRNEEKREQQIRKDATMKVEEGRRKNEEEGRRKKEEGRRKKEEGRRKNFFIKKKIYIKHTIVVDHPNSQPQHDHCV